MTKKRVRSVPIYVWVRPDELEVIRERMAEAGIRNMGAYMRKMALNGYVLHVDPVSYTHLDVYKRQAGMYGGMKWKAPSRTLGQIVPRLRARKEVDSCPM